MKKNLEINNSTFQLSEYDKCYLELHELWELPKNLTSNEKEFARKIMGLINLNDDDEYTIDMQLTPAQLMSLFVNIKRISENENN